MKALALAGLALLAAPCGAATPDDLLDAVRKGDLAAVRAALDAGVPVDVPFRYERTALSFAADRGNLEIVRLLLDRGADPNKKDSYYGMTAIRMAANSGQATVVRLLLERGAQAGPELLQSAVARGNAEVVAVALETLKLGADDLSGALAAATEAKKDAIADQLRKAGAVPPQPADFAVDAATLAAYAGTYRAESGDELRLEVKDAKLVCSSCAQGGMVLGAEDALTFRQPTRPKPRLRFTLAEGRPSACVLDFGDRQVSYKRAAGEPGVKP